VPARNTDSIDSDSLELYPGEATGATETAEVRLRLLRCLTAKEAGATMGGKILVTGGSGFLGSAAIAALRAEGFEVHALARSEGSARKVGEAGATAVTGDVMEPDSLSALPEGLDVVLHLAATPIMRPGTPPKKSPLEEVRRSRVEGTANLVRAVERSSTPRVFVSASAGAYAPGSGKNDEDAPIWTDNPYGALIPDWEAAAASDAFPSVRLRIPPVYGPTDAGGLGAVFLPRLRKGKGPQVIGNPEEPGSYGHVEDVAAAIVACATRCEASAVYNVADDTPVTPMEFARAAADAFGAKKPGTVPAFLVRLVLGKHLLRLIQTPPALDNGRLKAATGWAPRHPSPAAGWEAISAAMR
jgi:nucleoside-diphosphate-sugar epimerase